MPHAIVQKSNQQPEKFAKMQMREETDAIARKDLTDAQVASMQVQSAACSKREKKFLRILDLQGSTPLSCTKQKIVSLQEAIACTCYL